MRLLLIFILLIFNAKYISAQIFDVETIKFEGDNDKRINLVILSEGYQTSELDQFITDATNFTNDMFSQSPFLEYANYFNVYAIKVPSNESGADHPGTSIDPLEADISPSVPITTVDTYFNATYDSFGFHRLLYYEIDGNSTNNTEAIINTVLANNFPNYDQALILVNSGEYGASGGEFPMAYSGFYSSDIAVHELGHSLFNLIDEYYPIDDALAVEGINMTQETNPSLVRWKNWLNINDVGIYQHFDANGDPKNWYRPHQDCKMRSIEKSFCSVCKEGMIEKIHDLLSPIDSYLPVSNSMTASTYPIDFELDLIKPIPNTIESSWTLNGTNFGTNVDDVSILETDLNIGANTLTTVVNDTTTFLKIDNHETVHVYTVTWTINKSALGIDDILSKENNLSITLYPNPTNTIINLKIESLLDIDLKVDIIGLDGKLIKTTSVSNFENQQIDISNLSDGVYLANFYSNNIFLTSKRFVKN